MLTSKYLRLSSWGTALIPGTLCQVQSANNIHRKDAWTIYVRLCHQPLGLLDDSLRQGHVCAVAMWNPRRGLPGGDDAGKTTGSRPFKLSGTGGSVITRSA